MKFFIYPTLSLIIFLLFKTSNGLNQISSIVIDLMLILVLCLLEYQ